MKKVNRKYLAIGKFLKERREAVGLSQNKVKEILGYESCQLVSDWERGICGPPNAILKKLVKAYKISAGNLIDKILSAERTELESQLRASKANKKFGE